jgi:hypothetical protein
MKTRLITILGVLAGLVLVVTIATYLRLAFTGEPEVSPGVPPSSSAPPQPGAPEASRTAAVLDVSGASHVDDPAEFARVVATTIFEWDTAGGHGVEEYVARLIDIADPTGEETPGLVADLTGYLPNATAWTELRQYSTRQWLQIDSVTVPTLWHQAVAQAPQGALQPGSAAYTVTGVRHRTGMWQGKQVTSQHEVAFTIFMVCGPLYDACHLLRLSRLDQPLG